MLELDHRLRELVPELDRQVIAELRDLFRIGDGSGTAISNLPLDTFPGVV